MTTELLFLRFIGSECVECRAGKFWKSPLPVDRGLPLDLPSPLTPEIIGSLQGIAQRMSVREFRCQQFHSGVAHNRRLLEAQITVYSPDESVIVLRDVTLATRALANLEISTSIVAKLSSREVEVLRLLINGNPNKAVAARLEISEKTVEKYRANIMRKTGSRHYAQLIRLTVAAFADEQQDLDNFTGF